MRNLRNPQASAVPDEKIGENLHFSKGMSGACLASFLPVRQWRINA
jgi:hypothetical protein